MRRSVRFRRVLRRRFVVMAIVTAIASAKNADAQAYFAGGPHNWRPYGGYSPDHRSPAMTQDQVMVSSFFSGAGSYALFLVDQI